MKPAELPGGDSVTTGAVGTPPPRIVRAVAIVLCCTVLLWLSVAVTIAGVARHKKPELAVRFWPMDGYANAALADSLLQPGANATTQEKVRAYAKAGFLNDPTSARAVRVLGYLSDIDGNRREARARMLMAERLSRRDLLASLWLIDDAAARGDVGGALGWIDVALKTSSLAPQILFPILTGAIDDSRLIEPIGKLLATSPSWSPAFAEFAAKQEGRRDGLAKAYLFAPRQLEAMTPDLKRLLLGGLVDDRAYDTALKVYGVYSGGAPSNPRRVRNGDFRSNGRWAPFDWDLRVESDISAELTGVDGGLSVSADSDSGGLVARQMLALVPGNYRISSASSVDSDDPQSGLDWQLVCATAEQSGLVTMKLPIGNVLSTGTSAVFSVPAEKCSWQWLSLIVRASHGRDGIKARIAQVRIDPLQRHQASDRAF